MARICFALRCYLSTYIKKKARSLGGIRKYIVMSFCYTGGLSAIFSVITPILTALIIFFGTSLYDTDELEDKPSQLAVAMTILDFLVEVIVAVLVSCGIVELPKRIIDKYNNGGTKTLKGQSDEERLVKDRAPPK